MKVFQSLFYYKEDFIMRQEIKGNIMNYFNSIDNELLPKKYKKISSVILSGSAGWGIKEGEDSRADWDIHVIMPDEVYCEFITEKGENYIIDDQQHSPVVFIQFHDIKWLVDRLSGKVPNSWPLYLWIYTNCLIVNDPNCISSIVLNYKKKFIAEIDDLIKQYHILFSTRRLDTCSSALRGLKIATGLNREEMVKAALQVLCLLKNEPFAYNKWLGKEVELLYKDDADIEDVLYVCDQCLYETDLQMIVNQSKKLRDIIEKKLFDRFGEERWIHFWWEFNKN